MNFEDWMKQVDHELELMCGLWSSDLPDYCYRDAYEAGCSAEQVARDVMEAAQE
jgi:hypothetical protein